MDNYNELLEQFEQATQEANRIYHLIEECKDGYFYMAIIQCFGSTSIETATNGKSIQDIDKEWYGDNGLCAIYSNNPDIWEHVENYSGGGVVVIDEELVATLKAELAGGYFSYKVANIVYAWLEKNPQPEDDD
jgi:hypothetical protein